MVQKNISSSILLIPDSVSEASQKITKIAEGLTYKEFQHAIDLAIEKVEANYSLTPLPVQQIENPD